MSEAPGPLNETTYTEAIDGKRILQQRARVLECVLSQQHWPIWWTLRELRIALDYPEASISARLRDFRKPKFGEYVVDRRRRVALKGTWEYAVYLGDHPREIPHCPTCGHVISKAKAKGLSL